MPVGNHTLNRFKNLTCSAEFWVAHHQNTYANHIELYKNRCTCFEIWLLAWHTMCKCHNLFLASSLHQLHLFWVLLAHPSTYELLLYATWVGCHDVLCSWQLNTQLAGAWWAKCGQVGASVGISGGKLRQVCASRGQVGASGDQLGTSWD